MLDLEVTMEDQVMKLLDAYGEGMMSAETFVELINVLAPGSFQSSKQLENLVKALSLEGQPHLIDLDKLFKRSITKPSVAVFAAHAFTKIHFQRVVDTFPGSYFVDAHCTETTATLAENVSVVCLHASEDVSRGVLRKLSKCGVKLVLMFYKTKSHVDYKAAEEYDIKVLHVPSSCPHSVAEHAVSMALCLNRCVHRARNRTRDGNFLLSGLVGMDIIGKTVGVVGTGKVGEVVAKIFRSFDAKVLCVDPKPSKALEDIGCEYTSLDKLYSVSDIITLHSPLLPTTRHMINEAAIAKMKTGVMIINVSRGGLVDTNALIQGLRSGRIGHVGLDVYEPSAPDAVEANQAHLKVMDMSLSVLKSFPNVLITQRTASLTTEGLTSLGDGLIEHAKAFFAGKPFPESTFLQSATTAAYDLDASVDLATSSCSDGAVPAEALTPDDRLSIAVFSTSAYVKDQLEDLVKKFPRSFWVEAGCSASTASLCRGADAVCLFVNDDAGSEVIEVFKKEGVKLILLRCAGFDRVDLAAAAAAGIKVARVPAYSPNAVAEHAVTLATTVNRRLHLCYNRLREGTSSLSGLVGIELHGKTCGIIGTGKIGQIAAKIFRGFGMRVICFDVFPNDVMKNLGCTYVDLDTVYRESDVLSLHVPLLEKTKHMINAESIAKMKRGVIISNCSRGGLINTRDLIDGLETGKVGGAGLDVYENEQSFFFKDFTGMADSERIQNMTMEFSLLRNFPNVVLTPHSAFLTHEALRAICNTSITNATEFLSGKSPLTNEVKAT
eukprot:TRINITY_DN29610_c0_g2_i1.p1 TRINITY_DN29610_c0_g2~~TRINITY_DN29610_c0_g2_i1.p1  ORF type:complete len:779 (+),score=178.71 TRINITY_DN29610_c0_g2_i1:68-2404(+)